MIGRRIQIADTTLCREDAGYSFKEKLEITRLFERLCVDVIELPVIANPRTDVLFVRTASAFVRGSILSVGAGADRESIEQAAAALAHAAHPCIRIELPVSPVGMEYVAHRKPAKLLEWITEAVTLAKKSVSMVEFCAVDATRAEPEFLIQAIQTAVAAGADTVSVCDNAAEMLPDDFGAFFRTVCEKTEVPLGIRCDNQNGLALANAMSSVLLGATTVKTAVDGDTVDLETLGSLIRNCSNRYGIDCAIKSTELNRIIKQIRWIGGAQGESMPEAGSQSEKLILDVQDSPKAIAEAVAKLGYDLGEEDQKKVYEEFLRVAEKKTVGARELDAIVANTALQVPPSYSLTNYVINSGNIITASAQVTLSHEGKTLTGISVGDGPVAAAFLAIEQIIGHHYELDDFQIQAVTEGKEAMGSALVRLRSDGKLYAGSGLSTDILGASIRAYLSAVNKILYEEEQA